MSDHKTVKPVFQEKFKALKYQGDYPGGGRASRG
jgi:hypothetical protein